MAINKKKQLKIVGTICGNQYTYIFKLLKIIYGVQSSKALYLNGFSFSSYLSDSKVFSQFQYSFSSILLPIAYISIPFCTTT